MAVFTSVYKATPINGVARNVAGFEIAKKQAQLRRRLKQAEKGLRKAGTPRERQQWMKLVERLKASVCIGAKTDLSRRAQDRARRALQRAAWLRRDET